MTTCPHYLDNQGLCHNCGILMEPEWWNHYTGKHDMKRKPQYSIGVYCYGQKQWGRESTYDRLTTAPVIVAIATTEAKAQQWIAEEMKRQESAVSLQPGSGYHELYATISIDTPGAYLSKQNASRDNCNVRARKKALIESNVLKL